MSAARAILAKDVQELSRDGRALLTLGLVLLLGVAALWLSAQRMQVSETARIEAAARERQTWLSQGPANPHSVAHFSMYAFKPQTSLALFEPGLAPYLGEAIWLEAHYQDPARFRAAEDATEARRFADLSPAWIVAVALPLVVIALGFASLAREREQGLWRQLAATGVSSREMLWGKAGWLLAMAAGLAALVSLPTLLVSAGLPAPADAGMRWALIGLAVLLYAAALTGVTLAVSAASRTARGALLGLLAFWMVSVVLLPRLAGTAADALAPVPGATDFWTKVRTELREGRDERARRLEAETLERFGVAKVEDLPVSFAGIELQASEEHGNAIFDKHFGAIREAHARQQSLMRVAGFLSPAIAFRNASAAFAGTDAAHHWHFAAAAEAHRRKLVKILNDDMTARAKGQDFEYKADPKLWASIPAFDYAPPSWTVARGALIDLLILAFWVAGATFAAFAAIRRWRAA
jgi:ABC-2 type transport system permease protein